MGVLGVTVQSRLHIEFSLNMSKSEQTMSSAPPMEYAQTPQSVPPSYSEAIAQPYPQPVMHQHDCRFDTQHLGLCLWSRHSIDRMLAGLLPDSVLYRHCMDKRHSCPNCK